MKVTKINTTNGWGFGGFIGKLYDYENGLFMRKVTFYFRHITPESQTTYYFSENGLIQDAKTITKKEFDEKSKVQKSIAD